MAMRAKVQPIQKTETGHGENRQVAVRFQAATGVENQEWSRYTPACLLDITLKGDLADRFEIGKDYYLDFTEVD